MPMEQPEMERRIAQNANDIVSIYDLLSGIDATQAKHTIQLANVQHRLEDHSAKFDALDARFDAVDARFDAHDARFDAHDDRFDRIDTNIAELLRRLPD
jgi:chromosome segregation ATPase